MVTGRNEKGEMRETEMTKEKKKEQRRGAQIGEGRAGNSISSVGH